jgi:Dolichyl-phosphate-mannose-protein mannosyltransferase
MKTIFRVALVSLLFITLINPANLPPDTDKRLEMAHALWTGTEEISLPPNYRPSSRLENVGVLGVDGKRYVAYDMGQPLLMLPADWVGTQLSKVFPRVKPYLLREFAVSLFVVIPLNILLVLSCYWLLRLFDFQENIAGFASLICLLGTTILHYAQTFQQNNPVLLCTILGYACTLAYIKTNKVSFVFLSGLAVGAAILIRSTSIIHAITVFGFLISCLIYKKFKLNRLLKTVIFWGIGLFPFFFISKLFSYLRFGDFWASAASLSIKQIRNGDIFAGLPELPSNYPFIHPPYIGILGVLFSPAKSIFIYDPLLLPCLVLGIILFKKLTPYIKMYFISSIFGLIFHIIVTSKLDFWHGDGSWAARYHVTSVHLLVIPLIAVITLEMLSLNRIKRFLISSLIILSILVQFPSLVFDPSVNSGVVNFAEPTSFLQFRLGSRINSVRCLIGLSQSQDCLQDGTYNKSNLAGRVYFWPIKFGNAQGLLWKIWGLLFIIAFISTIIVFIDWRIFDMSKN